jgi:branched-chain amino acid aminotransferase
MSKQSDTYENSVAFFEGKFVPLAQANVNVMTHSFMYGTAVFEGIRGYWNEKQQQLYVFRLREHFERMKDSMRIMHLDVKYSVDELCDIVVELMRRNVAKTDMYIRPSAYKAGRKISPGLENNPTDLVIVTLPFGDYFESPGLKVQVSSWRRIEDNSIPARAKIVGAYVNTALAKTDAHNAGFDDCIVLSENGHVTEGSAMNLFMVKNGQLITSATTDNILEGITRGTIVELAKSEFGLQTQCRQVDRSELYTADELFFCGTGAQVTPVIEVDRRPVGNGEVGPIASKIRDAYIELCRGENPQYTHWLTPVYTPQATVIHTPAPAAVA